MSSESDRRPCPVCGVVRFVNGDPDRVCFDCSRLQTFIAPVGKWVYEGACARTDPEAFFPSHLGGTLKSAEAAKRVCAGCPVRQECLDYSLKAGEKWGVWGGLSEVERRKLLKEREAA